MTGETAAWVTKAVSTFGLACREKLSGPGEREAAIRSPLEFLLTAGGRQLGVSAVFHDEVHDTERQVRPDYGVSVGGAITGYVEVKAPERSIDPAKFTGHDKVQWDRQRDLPNLIYTNGTEWRLYRDGEPLGGPVRFTGSLDTAGASLTAPAGFETLVTDFLRWKPAEIKSVGALVKAVAPLTRLLRGEVLDQLTLERRAVAGGAEEYAQPFLGLARDWRALLFPTASDATFADGYAQSVTFALLLARTEGIELAGKPLHEIGQILGTGHSLMGKALQLLTDDVAADFKVTLDLLVRVVGAVNWGRVRRGRRDAYLHLYEDFLEHYDNALRKQSGSYYTPREVVEEMVRLTESALVEYLGKPTGFRDPSVLTVDPAMGTGTYLQTILERVAEQSERADGPGAVAGAVSQVAERLVGFEIQMGPYAVAELRAADLLALHGATAPSGGMRMFVTDTLDDPYAAESQFASGLQLIAQSRRRANQVKASANVTVVIGNPPYKELAVGDGGWVEKGGGPAGQRTRPILEDFFEVGAGRFKAKLKNLYIYFWRWATWKVWEPSTAADPSDEAGVVCFISTSAYATGDAFRGMRSYLRRYASEGWIIDLTPEGQTPDVPTRIFPGVRQPLAIGLFVRAADARSDIPAPIHYRAVSGKQADKFAALQSLDLAGSGWRTAREDWMSPFTPAAESGWDGLPAVSDIFPWYSPGVFPTRTWIYGPNRNVLGSRWSALRAAGDAETQGLLFKEGRDANLSKGKPPLPGQDTHQGTTAPVRDDSGTLPPPIRVGYRSFDRHWVLPDSRLMDMPRRPLWSARVPGQVFVVEQHTKTMKPGPGVVFSALIPDFDYFKGSEGGRTLPFLHPSGAHNLAKGLVDALGVAYGAPVEESEILAYVAGVTAHPAFTARFADELRTPGVRIPITNDRDLFGRAVELGHRVLRAHTYGEWTGAPKGVRYEPDDPRQPLALEPVSTLPTSVEYRAADSAVLLGDGAFGPVREEVWDYEVGGKNIIHAWVNYRKVDPGGRKGSPLDEINVGSWDADWTAEFIDLLTVLTRLVEVEPEQADLLGEIVDGGFLDMDELARLGVGWPTAPADRGPLYSLDIAPTRTQQTLDLG